MIKRRQETIGRFWEIIPNFWEIASAMQDIISQNILCHKYFCETMSGRFYYVTKYEVL